jgi:uncharacterized protein (TIGR00369 family)
MDEQNLEKLKDSFVKMNNFDPYLGNELEFLAPGKLSVKLKINENHLSSPQTGHGGVIAGMMDTVLGFTALSKTITLNNLVATVELKVNYLRPVQLGDELHGTADIVSLGKSLVVVKGEIKNQDGKMVSFGTGTFNQYPLEKRNILAQF